VCDGVLLEIGESTSYVLTLEDDFDGSA